MKHVNACRSVGRAERGWFHPCSSASCECVQAHSQSPGVSAVWSWTCPLTTLSSIPSDVISGHGDSVHPAVSWCHKAGQLWPSKSSRGWGGGSLPPSEFLPSTPRADAKGRTQTTGKQAELSQILPDSVKGQRKRVKWEDRPPRVMAMGSFCRKEDNQPCRTQTWRKREGLSRHRSEGPACLAERQQVMGPQQAGPAEDQRRGDPWGQSEEGEEESRQASGNSEILRPGR